MDVTSVARYLRVLALPLFLIGAGLFFYVLAEGSVDRFAVAAKAGLLFMQVAKAACGMGMLWLTWEVFQLYRWEAGRMQGDCVNCSGHMRQLDGRFGPYRKCKYCGNKEQGW